jgi:putative membrane protein
MMFWPHMGFGGFGMMIGMIFVWLFFIAVIAAIITFIVSAAKRSKYGHDYWHKMGDRSLEILKERYAKGEITKEQFDNMKKDIS